MDGENGFYTSPLQQRTAIIQLLALQSQTTEATRMSKEEGAADLGWRESVVARVLRAALSLGYNVRNYTYVDRDPIGRKIA